MPINPATIRRLRERAGLTKAEAARRASIRPSRWWELEAGRRPRPSAEILCRVAAVLGVQAASLMQ